MKMRLLKDLFFPFSTLIFGYRCGCLRTKKRGYDILRASYLAMFHMVRIGKSLEEKKELCWTMFNLLGDEIAALLGLK
jgi:hypothetical protein